MKKKHVNIILGIVTAAIWVILIREFLPEEEPAQLLATNSTAPKSVQNIETSYELGTNYPDPFRMKRKRPVLKKSSTKSSKKRPARIVRKSNRIIRWPQLEYKGHVKGNGSEVVLVKCHGKHLRLQENDSIGEFVLSAFSTDSLLLTYQSESKIYYR